MRARKDFFALVLLAPLLAGFGQDLPATARIKGQAKAEVTNIPVRQLNITSQVDLVGIFDPYLGTIFCSPDNKIILTRTVTSSSLSEPLGISIDGKSIIRFSASKMNDIPEPVLNSFFVGNSDVYTLTTGYKAENRTLRLRTPNGEIITQPGFTRKEYITHFRRDGTYAGAIPLDIPFMPLQAGIFPNGDFLIAGTMKERPKLALVRWNGQFQRFVELKGDIHLEQPGGGKNNGDPTGLPLFPKNPGDHDDLLDAPVYSSIIADGQRLLLFRVGQKTPVFSVAADGDVRAVTPYAPSGFTLQDLKAANGLWIVTYGRKISDVGGMEMDTYALNPATGRPIARYVFPSPVGFGGACSDGIEFTVLMRPKDKVQLVKLMTDRLSGSPKDSSDQDHQR